MQDWKKELVYQWNTIAGTEKTKEMRDSHVDMFTEECSEFMKAVNNQDLVEILDGLCDMYVVAWGSSFVESPAAIYQLNIARTCWMHSAFDLYTFDKAFREVMDSNFSKFCKHQEESDATRCDYALLGVTTTEHKVGDLFVIRSEDDVVGKDGKFYPKGKILKSINYFKPDLKRVLGGE